MDEIKALLIHHECWEMHPSDHTKDIFDGYYFETKEELHHLIELVAKEQDKNTRHKSVEVLNNHVYEWQEGGGKLTDPEFLNRLQNRLMNSNAPLVSDTLNLNE